MESKELDNLIDDLKDTVSTIVPFQTIDPQHRSVL